jgi:hypothetical protein
VLVQGMNYIRYSRRPRVFAFLETLIRAEF